MERIIRGEIVEANLEPVEGSEQERGLEGVPEQRSEVVALDGEVQPPRRCLAGGGVRASSGVDSQSPQLLPVDGRAGSRVPHLRKQAIGPQRVRANDHDDVPAVPVSGLQGATKSPGQCPYLGEAGSRPGVSV